MFKITQLLNYDKKVKQLKNLGDLGDFIHKEDQIYKMFRLV